MSRVLSNDGMGLCQDGCCYIRQYGQHFRWALRGFCPCWCVLMYWLCNVLGTLQVMQHAREGLPHILQVLIL